MDVEFLRKKWFDQRNWISSCASGLLATNELPLVTDDNETSPPIKFTNPLAISEDAELETDEPTVVPTFKTPTDLSDNKKFVSFW